MCTSKTYRHIHSYIRGLRYSDCREYTALMKYVCPFLINYLLFLCLFKFFYFHFHCHHHLSFFREAGSAENAKKNILNYARCSQYSKELRTEADRDAARVGQMREAEGNLR